jgi:hypothetical protein
MSGTRLIPRQPDNAAHSPPSRNLRDEGISRAKPLASWTGFYICANGGWAFGKSNNWTVTGSTAFGPTLWRYGRLNPSFGHS